MYARYEANTVTTGMMKRHPASGFVHTTVRHMSARLVFARDIVTPILSISGMRRYWGVPSANEMAVLMLTTLMRFSTTIATMTAAHSEGPRAPSDPLARCTIAREVMVERPN